MAQLLRITVGDLLDQVAHQFPKNEALVDCQRRQRWTYHQFLSQVNELSKGFMKLGVDKGDHVALWATNRSEWIVTEFALAKIGAVLVSIDTNSKLDPLEYVLRQSDSKVLVLEEGVLGAEYVEMIKTLCPEIQTASAGRLRCAALPELEALILISDRDDSGFLTWRELIDLGKEADESEWANRQRSVHCDDVATLLYTSGTTGAPKGVMSSHFGIINTSLASAEIQRLSERDRLCLSVPLHHMFGCVCIALAGVSQGATLVIPSRTFEPQKILRAIEEERCTAIYGSPSAFIAMMEDPLYRTADLRSLRTGIMGGAQCPLEVMKRVVEEMGVREIVIGYGQTESSSWITETRPEDSIESRVSTVGRPLPNVEVKIIDPKTGEEVPREATGELCARGLNMIGYYKMPAATSQAIDQQGWLHTGDLATMDQEGYVRIVGRLKEVITKGDKTVYPTEVEEVLFTHPKIINAQVFGVPDNQLGEEVAAWIQLEEGAEVSEKEIIQYLKARLSDFQIPRYVKFVKGFPMTPLGKIQKFKMREMAAKEYGLES